MVFLFLGRIQPYKGIFDLVEAFAAMPENCRLLIAGSPANDETATLLSKACIRDPRIQFYSGHVGFEEVQWFFQAANCVVFPFRKILSSGSVLLAMSFGKPLIVPDLPVIREVVDESDVWWFEPENPVSLKEALLLASKTWIPQMGKANLEIAKNNTWENMAMQTLNIYIHK
jgi:glycosyltransferase involved in cell wall biosynthesis